jgi:two-component system OmpR family response regulator
MKHTVLVVDDDPQFLTFIDRTLKRGGFSVLTATDGVEVPDILAKSHIDCLVLDLQMPGVNGWEVIRSLRRQPTGTPIGPNSAQPKIVVVSGRNEDETRAFVQRLGADAYLMKPLWGEEILSTVKGVLAN